jgi:hypothetical protein
MSETNDAVEAATIRDTIVRGFYGAVVAAAVSAASANQIPTGREVF